MLRDWFGLGFWLEKDKGLWFKNCGSVLGCKLKWGSAVLILCSGFWFRLKSSRFSSGQRYRRFGSKTLNQGYGSVGICCTNIMFCILTRTKMLYVRCKYLELVLDEVLGSDLDEDREDEGLGCQGDIGAIAGAGQMWLDDGAVLVVAIVTGWGWGGWGGGGGWGYGGSMAGERLLWWRRSRVVEKVLPPAGVSLIQTTWRPNHMFYHFIINILINTQDWWSIFRVKDQYSG